MSPCDIVDHLSQRVRMLLLLLLRLNGSVDRVAETFTSRFPEDRRHDVHPSDDQHTV